MKIFKIIAVSLFLAGFAACQEPDTPWDPSWNTPENPENPENPEKPQIKEPKPRYVWIDCAANFFDYANDRDKIAEDLARIKEVGFTDVIVDVRPTNGDVMFKSTVAAPMVRVDAWHKGSYLWLERTADFDYLQAFIEEGHKVGLKVNASVNTFVGGCLCPYGLGTDGMLYRDSAKKDWATVINSKSGLVNTMDLTDSSTDWGTRFLNPASSEVQKFLLQMLADLAKYDLDGIVLDRCRYDDYGLMSDFSEESRTKFESFIGYSITNYPSDIFAPGTEDLGNPTTLQKQWLAFRAKTIHDFMEKASAKVHSVNPNIRFGAYVGGWYSTYYTSGVNWASPKYDPSAAGYAWASKDYKDYGYADHCDFMFIGAYASATSIWGTNEWSMQGFCSKAAGKFLGDVPFAGGPDVGNSPGFENGGQASIIPDIIDACINASDGFFVFDLCHIKMYDYWDAFKRGFDRYLRDFEE
jgi:uncharacterized lipoprotein YddW (UPF0748 family)